MRSRPLIGWLFTIAIFCLASCKAQQTASNNSVESFKNKCPDHFDQVMMWKKEFSSKPDTVMKLFVYHFIYNDKLPRINQSSCLIGLKRSTIHYVFGQPIRKDKDGKFEEYIVGKEWTLESKGDPSVEQDRILILYYDLNVDTVVKYLHH